MSDNNPQNIKLEIRRNSDGFIAVENWPSFNFNTFWFEEGNASCDCNRELFFVRALGVDEPDDIDCSNGRFSVRISNSDSGYILYDEFGA